MTSTDRAGRGKDDEQKESSDPGFGHYCTTKSDRKYIGKTSQNSHLVNSLFCSLHLNIFLLFNLSPALSISTSCVP